MKDRKCLILIKFLFRIYFLGGNRTDTSILDAIATGAANALMIVLGIVSNIIAFLALIYFLNAVTEWCFELAGMDGVTFTFLLTKLFIPIVFVMGVPTYDCENIARVVAEKTFINEFVGYKSLGELIVSNKVDVSFDKSLAVCILINYLNFNQFFRNAALALPPLRCVDLQIQVL